MTKAVVEVNGIGYELLIPLSTYDKLPKVGEDVSLVTYLHVREDALLLYGFKSEEEKKLFILLISTVSGIGPKLAVSILSGMPVAGFCSCIAKRDAKALSRINGIGKRSAERLVVELQGKIQEISPAAGFGDGAGSAATEDFSKEAEDAVSALVSLGYKMDIARKQVSALLQQHEGKAPSAQMLIRKALTQLKQ